MKRITISLPSKQYVNARRTAAERGISLSELCCQALDCLEREDSENVKRMMSIVGIVKGADRRASVDHDRILYGWEPHE